MNNNPLFEVEDKDKDEDKNKEEDEEHDEEYDEEHEKFMARMRRLDELLTKYENLKEEEKEEDMKLEIWNAHVRDEIIGIEMKDGVVFVGKSKFSYGENFTSVDQLKEMTDIKIQLANGVPFGYHIGGKSVNLFISKIKRVFVMTESEVADANQYANMAPEFIKRF
jgi:membrane-associated HD superfamily phosphohydrolase